MGSRDHAHTIRLFHVGSRDHAHIVRLAWGVLLPVS